MEKIALRMVNVDGKIKGFDNGKDWYIMDSDYAKFNIEVLNTCKKKEIRLFDTVAEAEKFNKLNLADGVYVVEIMKGGK